VSLKNKNLRISQKNNNKTTSDLEYLFYLNDLKQNVLEDIVDIRRQLFQDIINFALSTPFIPSFV